MLFEDGVLVRSQDLPYRMHIHPDLIATEERCDTLFQRLSDFHSLIEVLKLEVEGKIDHPESGEMWIMIFYQKTAAEDTKGNPISSGADIHNAKEHIPEPVYEEYLDECGEQLRDDLMPYWKGLMAEFEDMAPLEDSIPVNQPGQSQFLDLPPKIIANIVKQLTLMDPVKPFPPIEFKRPCPCQVIGADFRRDWLDLEDTELPEESTDPTLALSCVSRKLRSIAFENRPERTVTLGFCSEAIENLTFLPSAVRRHVT
jgi:hypothetical protein